MLTVISRSKGINAAQERHFSKAIYRYGFVIANL
jgi:hypothetical protein